MNRPQVTVGIVTYNSSSDIDNCLKSLYQYTPDLVDLKVYVYDNLSPDSDMTRSIVSKGFPAVVLIAASSNKGFGYGHNQIISQVDSSFHLVLNADVEFKEDSISPLIDYMLGNQDTVLISPEIRNTDGSIQYLPKKFPKFKYILSSNISLLSKYRIPYTRSDENLVTPTEMDVCTGCFMFAKTQDLKRVSGFDERFFLYFEDLDIALRLRRFGKIIYFPGTYVIHRWFRGPMKSKKLLAIQIKSMMRFYSKWLFRGV